MTRTKYNWDEIEKYFGELTDREIADRFNISRKIIANKRIKTGVGVVTKWNQGEKLLGTMPDKDLAILMGITANAVTVKRLRSGIPRYGTNSEWQLETFFCSTLQEPFERQVSTPLGRIDILTPTTIYECKYQLTAVCQLHQAIGQLTCYGDVFPDRQKAVVCAEIELHPSALSLLGKLEIEIVQVSMPIPVDVTGEEKLSSIRVPSRARII